MVAAIAGARVTAIEPAQVRAADSILSPEFLLAAACCRWPPSGQRLAAISTTAKDIRDWDSFLRVVKRQRVTVAVCEALRLAGVEPPAAVAGELTSLAQRYIHRSLQLAAETVRLQNLLAAADIPVIVLKGAAVEQLAYGSLCSKQTRDIDLLVLPECAETAMWLIEDDGYALALPAKQLSQRQCRALVRFGREVELVDPRKGLRLELQWRAADNALLLKGLNARARTQDVVLSEGFTVRTLAPDDLFAYLCVHGAHHFWSRLKWLADVNALLASSHADIERLYRHAHKIGAGLCAGQALLLCHRLLGLNLPASIIRELQTNKRCEKLAAIAIAEMTATHTATEKDPGIAGVVRAAGRQFLLGQGLAFYLAQCRLASVAVADIVRLPLPRPLHFIYPLVRLPLWLWRRIALVSSV
jgi:hypothetical protein